MACHSRRGFLQSSLTFVSIGLLTGCGIAARFGQQPPRVPVIGLLHPGLREARARVDAPFLEGMRDLGYVEGRNIAIEYRYAESNDRLADLAAELVGLPVDLIFATGGTPAAVAAKQATATIPIVFIAVADPVGTGLAASLAHPGGNLTGTSNLSAVLAAKQVELLKAIIPGFSRLALILNTTNPAILAQEKEITAAAQVLGIQMQVLRIRSAGDYEGAFRAAAGARADAIYLGGDAVGVNARDQLAELGLRYRLPTAFDFRENADAGGLLSYGANVSELYRRAATYVDKILKGAKPADLPVEQPTRFDFVINLKTAEALGLAIPQEVLMETTEIIQ